MSAIENMKKIKLHDAEIKTILWNAELKAAKAARDHIQQHGEHPFNCGFAWVKIRPARGQFIKVMKEIKMGKTDDFEGGYMIWNPSGHPTQDMSAKEAGAKVFAEILRSYGLKVSTHSRLD